MTHQMKILPLSTLYYIKTEKYSGFGLLLCDKCAGQGQYPKHQLRLLYYAVIRILEELLHVTFSKTAHTAVRKGK
jgi:hypothetical protein